MNALLLLFLLCSFCFGLIVKDYEIFDLTATIVSEFTAEANEWDHSALKTTGTLITTTCGSKPMLGGPNSLAPPRGILERSYDLPPHKGLTISVDVSLIDAWTLDNYLLVQIWNGSQVITSQRAVYSRFDDSVWSRECGQASSPDMLDLSLILTVTHSNPKLKITFNAFTFDLLEGAEFGIRNLKILLEKDPIPDQIYWMTKNGQPSNLFENTFTLCPVGTFDNPSGTGCLPCAAGGCELCGAPSLPKCWSCKNGYVYDGKNCVSCPSTCPTCASASSAKCLSCPAGHYLYGNLSCLPTCSSPYQIRINGGVSYCDFGCPGTEFFFPDNSCGPTCEFPNVAEIEGDRRYCKSLCTMTSFLYTNKSCLPTCDPPMLIVSTSQATYCNPPCSNTSLFYDFNSTTCNETCEYPYRSEITEDYKGCFYLVPQAVMAQIDNVAPVTNWVVLVGSIILMGESWGVIVLIMSRMLQYVRYFNIFYFYETLTMQTTWKMRYTTVDLGVKPPLSLLLDLPLQSINSIFEEYSIHSNFLINIWPHLLALLITFGILVVCRLVEFLLIKKSSETSSQNPIIRKIRTGIQNIFLMMFLSGFGNFVFYAIIEGKKLQLNSFIEIVSFSLSVILLISMALFLVFYLIFLVRQSMQKEKKTPTEKKLTFQTLLTTHAGFQILFKNFKDDSYQEQAFLFNFFLRDIFYNMLVALLPEYPVYETLLISFLAVAMMAYLVFVKPMRSLVDMIIQLVWEGMILITILLSCFSAIQDNIESNDESMRVLLGKVIITIHMIFHLSIYVSLGAKILQKIREIYLKQKSPTQKAISQPADGFQTFIPAENFFFSMSNFYPQKKQVEEQIEEQERSYVPSNIGSLDSFEKLQPQYDDQPKRLSDFNSNNSKDMNKPIEPSNLDFRSPNSLNKPAESLDFDFRNQDDHNISELSNSEFQNLNYNYDNTRQRISFEEAVGTQDFYYNRKNRHELRRNQIRERKKTEKDNPPKPSLEGTRAKMNSILERRTRIDM